MRPTEAGLPAPDAGDKKFNRHGVVPTSNDNNSAAEIGMFKLLPIRLVIGFGFMAHGWARFSRGPSGFAELLTQIGAPLSETTAWVSTFVELLGGLAVFAGAFVGVVSVPLIVMMLVAMFTVHLKYGFSCVNTIGLTEKGPQFGPPGYEINLLHIAGLLSLILGGAGLCPSTAFFRPRRGFQVE
jgi:putative oxidoreductase